MSRNVNDMLREVLFGRRKNYPNQVSGIHAMNKVRRRAVQHLLLRICWCDYSPLLPEHRPLPVRIFQNRPDKRLFAAVDRKSSHVFHCRTALYRQEPV